MSNGQQQQEQFSSEFGDESTGIHHQPESKSAAAVPLLEPSSSDAANDGGPRPINPQSPTTASSNGQTTAMSGRLRSTSTGDRPKAYSVQIVEPLPTLGGTRGSRASVGGGYTVIKSEEKHGILQRAIPVMPLSLAIVACVLNILLPGIGTIVTAFSVFCCRATTRIDSKLNAFLLNVVAGLLQLTTFLLIVGWIWSISWGMTFVQLAISAKENNVRAPVPYYVRRHSSVE